MTIRDPLRGKCVICNKNPQRNKGHRPSGARYWGQKCDVCHKKRVSENRVRRANGLPTLGVDGREIDHTGRIINGQLVLGRGESRSGWRVRCSCGYERDLLSVIGLRPHCKRCSCLAKLREYTDKNPRPCELCGQPATKKTRRRKDCSAMFDKRCQNCKKQRKQKRRNHARVLYAIEAREEEGGPVKYVKFGISTNLRKRLEQLQSSCPLILKGVAFEPFGADTRLVESFVLKACSQFQARGEWLMPAEEVLFYIGAIRHASASEEHKRAMLDEAMAWDHRGRVMDYSWEYIDGLIEGTKILAMLADHAEMDVYAGTH